jgi:hypothetical protein
MRGADPPAIRSRFWLPAAQAASSDLKTDKSES